MSTAAEQNYHHLLNYKVRSPWSWVFQHGLKDATLLQDLGANNSTELMSYRKFVSQPDSRKPGPCTLRAEIVALDDECEEENVEVLLPCRIRKVVIGTSACLEGLSDKDLFASTVMKHNADFSIPPTLLINWDASEEDCRNIQFPVCDGEKAGRNEQQEEVVAVLKLPLGSRGEGVFFVSTHEEIIDRVQDNYKRAVAEKNGAFLKDLLASKGRIPSWTLSGEIQSMLIRGRRKFHLRSYVALIEREDLESKSFFLDGYVYSRHEVRVAENSIDDAADNDVPPVTTNRDRRAHITNGASSGETGRYMLQEIDELKALDMDKKLEEFVTRVFDQLAPDLVSRVRDTHKLDVENQGHQRQHPQKATKFAIAGIDIMLDDHERLYILEVNVNPAAPPEHVISDTFRSHLVEFSQDLTRLVFANGSIEPGSDNTGGWKPMNSFAILQ